MDKPVVRAFPCFLQDFAYPVFVFFQGAKHRELITGGVADAHLAIDGRELLGDTAREFVIQRFQRAVRSGGRFGDRHFNAHNCPLRSILVIYTVSG